MAKIKFMINFFMKQVLSFVICLKSPLSYDLVNAFYGVFTKIIEVISTKHGRSKLQVDPREANLMGKLGGQTNLRGKLMNPFTRGKA